MSARQRLHALPLPGRDGCLSSEAAGQDMFARIAMSFSAGR